MAVADVEIGSSSSCFMFYAVCVGGDSGENGGRMRGRAGVA